MFFCCCFFCEEEAYLQRLREKRTCKNLRKKLTFKVCERSLPAKSVAETYLHGLRQKPYLKSLRQSLHRKVCGRGLPAKPTAGQVCGRSLPAKSAAEVVVGLCAKFDASKQCQRRLGTLRLGHFQFVEVRQRHPSEDRPRDNTSRHTSSTNKERGITALAGRSQGRIKKGHNHQQTCCEPVWPSGKALGW